MAIIGKIIQAPLKWLRKFFRAAPRPALPGVCLICHAGHPDLRRLAQIVGKLPIGQRVPLSKVRAGLDANFKTVAADLKYLASELLLPIEFDREGATLTGPVWLCENHFRIGASFAARRHSAGINISPGQLS